MTHLPAHSRATRLLHWSVAAGLSGMLAFGLWVASLPSGKEKGAWVQTHKSFGMMVASLMLARLVWRTKEGWPASAAHNSFDRIAARTVQTLLLTLSLAMPLTGIVASITYARPVAVFGIPVIPQLLDVKNDYWNALAGVAHAYIAFTLIGLIALHIAGALRHHFLLGDATLSRMTRGAPSIL
jgi:cytochrome b561